MRANKRLFNELRPVFLGPSYAKYAEGSCFVKFGETHVICTATVEEKVPPFLRNKGSGWITAEYGMLPRATHQRVDREASKGKQTGRTQEIQRLIGRSLRAVVDLALLGERQVKIDCDVLQADGGTRTASITGAYVALHQALARMVKNKILEKMPITGQVAAISCGLVKGEALLDLDYPEDSAAEVDANFVITDSGNLVEIQATAEKGSFGDAAFGQMLQLARTGVEELIRQQKEVLKIT